MTLLSAPFAAPIVPSGGPAGDWRKRRREKRDRAACLLGAVTSLVGALTVEEVVEAAFRDALPVFEARVAVAFLLSEDARQFHALRLCGPSAEEGRTWQTFPAETPVPIADAVRAGAPIVLADRAAHDARYPQFAADRALYGEGMTLAYPFLAEGCALGGLGLILPEGRSFDQDDHRFLMTLTGVCAQALERIRLHDAERDAQAALAAAYARERLVNEIGEAVRAAAEPAAILQAVVTRLGPALGADRCYYVTYDPTRDHGRVGPEWRRAGLAAISGEYRMSDYPYNAEAAYRAGQTQMVEDVLEYASPKAGAAAAAGLRSLVRAPLKAGPARAALAVAMADSPRRWTPGEVGLVETVAAQTQMVLEAARTHRRERTIAEQLQAALLPPIPRVVPGLDLASHHQPALAETEGVGGDFCDVFTAGKSVTFLVLGDLSGKGLAAAAQVATVRNMVRYAVYRGRTLAGALTNLNAVLVEQGLISGFSTLFVGSYDAASRTLAYVNCGQEPALVWRRETGAVELLEPTGPVLGGYESAVYAERVVTLVEGDALAVFSDGLTEAGPDRTRLLGLAGVAALLGESAPLGQAARIAPRLITGADRFAGGVLHDDVCLLVGVVGAL